MKWEKVKLKDICVSITDGTHQAPPKTDFGIPFITIANITGFNKIDFSNTNFVTKEYYETQDEKRTAKPNDILYSVVGSFGIPVYIKEDVPFVFQRHIAILKTNENVDAKYLYYVMLSKEFYQKADTVALGAAQRTISLNSLRNLEVVLPPIDIQNRISSILSTYDDLIENNQKQIKLLEEAAQRLYKEWFVDLRFPGHENVKIVDGVPEGWELHNLGEQLPVITGKKDANFGTKDGNYPFFTCSQETLKAPSYSFDTNAIILAGNGDFNVKLYRGKFEAYQRTYVLVPYKANLLYLVYQTIKENMKILFQGASGSTIKFLTKNMILKLPIIVPSQEVLLAFNNLQESMQCKLENKKKQVQFLQEARDRILPKLISGEIEL